MKSTSIVATAVILLQAHKTQTTPISNLLARKVADIQPLLELFLTFFPETEYAWYGILPSRLVKSRN